MRMRSRIDIGLRGRVKVRRGVWLRSGGSMLRSLPSWNRGFFRGEDRCFGPWRQTYGKDRYVGPWPVPSVSL